jgi:hypothetical protein
MRHASTTAGRGGGPTGWPAVHLGLALIITPVAAAATLGDGAWVLTEISKSGAASVVSAHATLAACLDDQKSREAAQRAYLRAANESSPRDQLPLPALTVSFRCVQK